MVKRKVAKRQTVDVQTKYGLFLVALERDGRGHMVSVPRMPEVVTFGQTVTEAKHMAQEAIEVAIEGEILVRAAQRGDIKFLA